MRLEGVEPSLQGGETLNPETASVCEAGMSSFSVSEERKEAGFNSYTACSPLILRCFVLLGDMFLLGCLSSG